MTEERQSFQDLPGTANPQFLENGKKIYEELKAKYPERNIIALDNITNSLCAALACLMHVSVSPDDRPHFIQIIYKILNKNIN